MAEIPFSQRSSTFAQPVVWTCASLHGKWRSKQPPPTSGCKCYQLCDERLSGTLWHLPCQQVSCHSLSCAASHCANTGVDMMPPQGPPYPASKVQQESLPRSLWNPRHSPSTQMTCWSCQSSRVSLRSASEITILLTSGSVGLEKPPPRRKSVGFARRRLPLSARQPLSHTQFSPLLSP